MRRPRVVLGAVGLLLLAVVGVFVYRNTLDVWRRLESAGSSIEAPTGFKRLFTAREGTVWCFISCDEARLNVVFETRLPTDEACTRFRNSIAEDFDVKAVAGVEWFCPFEASLPSVKDDARLRVASADLEEFRSDSYKPAWFARLDPPAAGDRIVWLQLNSGLE